MAGDKKALIFFGDLELSTSFQERLRNIRKQFGVPVGGFKEKQKATQWLWGLEYNLYDDMFKEDNKNYRKLQAYKDARKQLIKDFNIPPPFGGILNKKIVYSKNISIEDWEYPTFGCSILEYGHEEETFDPKDDWDSKKSYAILLIHDGANKSDVKKYIEKNWYRIEKLIESSKRIYKRRKRGRDEIILDLCNKSGKELVVKNGLSKEYRIRQILAEKHTIYTSEGNIKRICTEERKRRR